MKASICEKTISYGKQRWRVSSTGECAVLMWGWWPESNGYPEYRWVAISKDKVPTEVMREANK